MEKNLSKWLWTIAMVLVGNIIYALGIVLFIEPSGLITGGVTGIGLAVNHVTNLQVSTTVLIMNSVMFILGMICLGKKFAFNTLVSTFSYPIILAFTEKIAGGYMLTDDLLICAIFGGFCIGSSIAIIISSGASSGGMDIPPLVLNKYFRVPVSISLWVIDCLILVGQAVFSPTDKILYGILLVMIYTIVLDRLLVAGKSKLQLKIVSEKSAEIKEGIIDNMDRGVTMLNGNTGYLNSNMTLVLTIISARELAKAEQLVYKIDPDAFLVISRVTEVKGHGFSMAKRYL